MTRTTSNFVLLAALYSEQIALGWNSGKPGYIKIERIAVMQGCNRTTVQTGATNPKLMILLECQSRVSLILAGGAYPLG